MAGQFHGDETRVIQSVRRSFVSHSSVDVCPRKLDAKIHAKGRTFLMFLRETLLSVPVLRPGHRDYRAPVSGVWPGRVSRRRSPVISGTSRDLNTGERDSAERERENIPREKKRELCHYGTAWSELERGKRRGRVTRDDNGHVSWELGIYLSRALGTRTSTSTEPGRPWWPEA